MKGKVSEEIIMTTLLVFREQLKNFYSKYELYLTPFFKFLLALMTLVMINSSIGYMSELKKTAVVLVFALICAVMPMNFIKRGIKNKFE